MPLSPEDLLVQYLSSLVMNGMDSECDWFDIDLFVQLFHVFHISRDLNYFHITHPFCCRVQLSFRTISAINADAFIPGGHTIQDNLS